MQGCNFLCLFQMLHLIFNEILSHFQHLFVAFAANIPKFYIITLILFDSITYLYNLEIFLCYAMVHLLLYFKEMTHVGYGFIMSSGVQFVCV